MSVYRGATVAFGTRHGKQHQVADAFAAILGAHVTAPVTGHEEMLLFRDTRRGIEVVEGERVPLALPGPVRVATVDQAAPFLDRACPGYGRTGAEPACPARPAVPPPTWPPPTGTAAPAARTAAGCRGPSTPPIRSAVGHGEPALGTHEHRGGVPPPRGAGSTGLSLRSLRTARAQWDVGSWHDGGRGLLQLDEDAV